MSSCIKNKNAFNGVVSKISVKTGVKWQLNEVSGENFIKFRYLTRICRNALTFPQLFMCDRLFNGH
jgi:hypothetical protein